jgi:lysophospholipase L1-like esterase
MRLLAVLLGVLAAIAAGALALFVYGEAVAAGLLVALLVLAVLTARAGSAFARAMLVLFLVVFVGAASLGGWHAYTLAAALTASSGAADAPEPAALASAERKLDALDRQGGFRVELTAAELEAVIQDAIAQGETPIRRVEVTIVGAGPEPGYVEFTAHFKSGSLTARGSVAYELHAGEVRLRIREAGIGRLALPAVARGAVEDLIERISDLNSTLTERRVTVQRLDVRDGAIVVIGTQADGRVITSASLLAGLSQRVSGLAVSAAAPAERIGLGEVDGPERAGDPVYVALGDSLAANVGVDRAREGYVSRVHAELQRRDGRPYGLRNFGVSGETSATMLRAGQLDAALDFMRGRAVAYVSIDIGANDLLPHLGSDDCAGAPAGPACTARVEASLEAYATSLADLFARLRAAAPTAEIVFLQTYNPFSLGLALDFERATDQAVMQLNAVATRTARAHGIRIADGFTPMKGTASATTHMTASPPDIHPRSIGYAVLAAALLDALD